jgi:UV DNA damage repair endonuclease
VSRSITQNLPVWRRSQADANERPYPLVYDEHHHLTHRVTCHERSAHTLQTIALINDDWVRREFYGPKRHEA